MVMLKSKLNNRLCGRLIFILAALLFFCSCEPQPSTGKSPSMKQWKRDILRAAITPLKTPIDIANVGSVAQYITLLQMNRGLVKLNKNLQFEGDIAQQWFIDKNLKNFEFKIKPDQKFSDGTPIKASHIACSFQRQIKLKSSIHFNFDSIEKVTADDDDGKIKIILKSENPRFLQQISHPEFSILTHSNCQKKINELDWTVTSGPYFLLKQEKENVILKRNPHYDNFLAPEKLILIGANKEQMIQLITSNEIDFCLGTGELDNSTIHSILTNGKYVIETPHIGFTYWLSINEHSNDLNNKSSRLMLQALLSKALEKKILIENPSWSKAYQMYLPDGSGRLSKKEVNQYWEYAKNITIKLPFKKVNVLLQSSFKWNKEIIESLKEQNLDVDVHYYNTLSEFAKITKEKVHFFHLILINNDYSSPDLFENLKVTFNNVRPLVFQKSYTYTINNLLKKAEHSIDINNANRAYKDIEELMLKEALIIPLVHNHMNYYVKKEISIDDWSKLSPEVSFWKIKPRY